MPTYPWRWVRRPDPEGLCVSLLSYLPLRSGWRIPQLLLHMTRILRQLRRSRRLLGYSLRADLGVKQFWTLSAWEDEAALQAFVRTQPHARAMTVLEPHLGATTFIRWAVKGSELPVGWEEALRRWRRS
jgi:quinol monooxygenase YgiN